MQTYFTHNRRRTYLPRRFKIRLWPNIPENRTLSHIDLQRKAAAQARLEPRWSGTDAKAFARKTAFRLYGQHS
jgi:hypothetical protein